MPEVDERELTRCPICEAVNIKKEKNARCRRCGSKLHHHRHFETEKSWAYLIAAIIFYIPANLYPMLITEQFGSREGSTIFGGIVYLWEHGSYPIALIILFASIFVPILKFLLLIYLLISVKYPIGKDKKVNKHKLYYITELIGPWSMIDVFVVVILVGLIRIANIQIIAGAAATSFALSVLFTLLAAHAFNQDLIREGA